MAQLNIEQASVGYDVVGIQDFLSHLNLDVIDALSQKINDSMSTLREATDEVWVGQSANAFKSKLERDSRVMIDTLNGIEDDVRGQFAQIAKNVDNYDQTLAESINSME